VGVPEPSALTSAQFREVVGRFASGVTVVTTHHDGALRGGTASAFTSLSDAPPMVLVCLNRASATAQAVRAAGTFAVNVLGEGQDALAARFAAKGPDKFAGVAVTPDPLGPPLLDDAIAHLVCRVDSVVTGGTHLVFLGVVERAGGRPGPPLAYFRGSFARMLPLPRAAEPADPDALHDAYRARAAIEVGACSCRAWLGG
jgi:flavin reductase (DIM6/NTAB) family NADH-FMN oxidoreductase RutF